MAVNWVRISNLRPILPKHFNNFKIYFSSAVFSTFQSNTFTSRANEICKIENIHNRKCTIWRQQLLSTSPRQQITNFSTSQFKSRKGEYYNRQNDQERNREQGLMNFPQILMPSIFKGLQNQILSRFVIKLLLDRDFDIQEFGKGARKALAVVAKLLHRGDIDEVANFVTSEAFEEIKTNVRLLTSTQLQWLSIVEEDICFSFPYQIGIMIEDVDGVRRQYVEITYCYYCLLGLQSLKPQAISDIFKYRDDLVVANCRFIKEYTKGVESDWTLNIFNIFKPEPPS